MKILKKIATPLLLLTVIAPTVIATVYFGLLASDSFLSESKIVVRSIDRQTQTGLGALLKNAGFTKSQDDSYTVKDYLLSRDALSEIERHLSVSKSYSSSNIDALSRFNLFNTDNSFESLFKYFKKKIEVEQEVASSIITLTTHAYTAQDAKNINENLLILSEALINKLNERGRQDLITSAASEVEKAAIKAKAAALALSVYRNTNSVVDPERQATVQLQQIAKIQDELIQTKLLLTQLSRFTPENSQISPLKLRVLTLQNEIVIETGKAAGNERSLSNKAVDFQRLTLERDFSEKQLGSAFSSLESARNDAQRKQIYIERIVQPNLPDSAAEPRRFREIASTFILGLMAFGILSILISGVKEHKD